MAIHTRMAVGVGLLGAVLAGCVQQGGTVASTPSGSSSAAPGTSAGASARAPTSPAGTSGASTAPAGPAGGPVPAGFRAWSVTFVSDRQAFLLGDAPCHRPPCTSVVRTEDAGRSWRGVPAPRVPLPTGSPISRSTAAGTVRDLRFATPTDGYAFGGGLWTTHDGAASWRRVSAGAVLDLATDGRTVYAVVADCAAGGTPCRGSRLVSSPVSRDDFRRVAGLAPGGGVGGGVSVGGGTVVAILDGAWYVRSGGAWRRAAVACPTTAVVAPAAGSTLTAFCGEGAAGSVYSTVRQSTDAGRTWTTVPGRPLQLPNGLLSFTAGSTTVLAAASASPDLRGGLSVSRDGGRTWSAAPLPVTAAGWRYVGARAAAVLVALQDPPAAVLWTSSTAGRTWTAYRIR